MNDNEKMFRFKRMAANMAGMIDWPYPEQMERASRLWVWHSLKGDRDV